MDVIHAGDIRFDAMLVTERYKNTSTEWQRIQYTLRPHCGRCQCRFFRNLNLRGYDYLDKYDFLNIRGQLECCVASCRYWQLHAIVEDQYNRSRYRDSPRRNFEI
jgi:hypothetical protein